MFCYRFWKQHLTKTFTYCFAPWKLAAIWKELDINNLKYKNSKKVNDYIDEKTFDYLHTFVKESLQLDNIRKDTAKSESITNFLRIIQNGVTIVKFYSPTCTHCQNFAPIWDQLTSTYATKLNVKFSDVDCTEGELCEQQGIDRVPTLHVYKNGKKIDEYTEGWSYGEVHSFVKKYID